MCEKITFVGSGPMTAEDVKKFIQLFEMNQVEAELSNEKVKIYTLRITEEEKD